MIGGAELAAVAFGLAASLSWGVSDFGGGLVTRRLHIVGVAFYTYSVGLVLMAILALVTGEPWPAPVDLAWGGVAGLAGTCGLVTFYRALAVGRMGIVAPVAAVLGASSPVLFGALNEGLPASHQWIGFGLALVGVWLVTYERGLTNWSDGLGLAILAGLSFGAFFITIDRITTDAVFWPLVAARIVAVSLLLALGLPRRREWWPEPGRIPLLLLIGVLDVGGNLFFLLAVQSGRLDVATVLSSLYPAITVLLARVVLKESFNRWQAVGVVAALVAVPLIAA